MSAAENAFAARLILVLCAVLPSTRCRAEHYVFDAKHTEVRFAYTFGSAVQYGRFTSVEGTMEFDEKMPERSHAEARVKTASLTTGEPFIDDELKSRASRRIGRVPRQNRVRHLR